MKTLDNTLKNVTKIFREQKNIMIKSLYDYINSVGGELKVDFFIWDFGEKVYINKLFIRDDKIYIEYDDLKISVNLEYINTNKIYSILECILL